MHTIQTKGPLSGTDIHSKPSTAGRGTVPNGTPSDTPDAHKEHGGSFLGMTGAGPCPKADSSLLSKLVFQWMQPVFKKGYREPLTMNDLWDIPESLDAEILSDKFEKAWLAELALYKLTVKPDTKRVIDGGIMRSALWKLWKAEVFPLSFMFIFSQLCSVFSPFMQQFIIEFVQLRNTSLEQPLATGIGYAMGLFALQILGTLVSNHFQQTMMMKSMAVSTMVKTAIYRKSLKLAPQARQKFGSGQIINLVTTDTMRIQMFMMQAVFVFVLPITLIITIGFLIAAIGWAAVIGISLLLFAVPLQTWLFKKMKVIRAKQAPITDSRVKKTTEILNGVRVIKLFNWETSFFRMVQEIRQGELVQVLTRSVYQALVMTQAQTIPALCTCVSFVVYGLMNPLSASKVFSSMSWFNQLRMPLWMLPNILNSWAEFNVALTRVESLLLANELDEGFATQLPQDSKYAVVVEGGEFSWNGPVYSDNLEAPPPPPPSSRGSGGKRNGNFVKSDAEKPPKRASPAITAPPSTPASSLLKNINFKIEKERLTVIVGPVGSGKSSLLNALIGEMQIVQGSISTQDSMAYAAQTAWIQNATVKDNIIFGAKFDKTRYLQVLYNAALLPDLRILKDKDQTSIGERGINLSGGQKQRINIARLMYNDAKIVLLDDPLSAVDAHVGRHLFEKCILENMKGRTRVLVTHQLHFVPQCDHVIFMKDGLIVEQGSYSDLMHAGGGFAEMMKAHGGGGAEHSAAPSTQETEQQSLDLEAAFKELQELTAPRQDSSDIMTKEDQAVGGVSSQVWWRYILACGGVAFCIEAVLLVGLNEGTTVINNLWLTWWTSNAFQWLTNTQYALIYVGLALLSSVATFAYGYFFAFTGTRASKVMHEKALERILACPVYFFDTTPVGRIINRFSADIDALDNSVASNLRQLASTASNTVATFTVMIIALPVFAAAVVPAMIVYWFVQDIYRRTARELKRLSSTARSPLYNNFGETLTGVATIRAYRDQERFIWRNDVATNVSNSPQYYLNTAGNWLSIRLQLLGSLLVAFAAILGITSNALSATLFGLCLTYSLSITQTLANMVQSFTQCEISMNSAERVEHYAYRVETEKDDAKTREPPKNWPASGTIAFSEVTMRYAPTLPVVLDAVSFDVRDREKVGIVGRTGSGKSSLMQALFRIAQTEGSICVDGVDISTLALKSVRTALAIIPQDPVVFSGSFRTNMDPFAEHTDADLWDALERAGLKRKVESQDEKLDANVDAGGDNLSVGERQLLCLARAMLKKPKILIMDEATANVDMETDSVIQKSLREEFRDTTILTIAHRLNTIMDYDRVLVLDHGKVAEFDSPRALVADESTIFHSLVMGTGETNAEVLKKMVL
ncbi:P-loop containing nucleoside triphosphate hydrolase protein [Chytriomyces cf. hyalinus JEL632]|nr:P-loop containing nucleoside triphosphate hydrolase protein [Chytriomyces cf. hyalinus JEL632]